MTNPKVPLNFLGYGYIFVEHNFPKDYIDNYSSDVRFITGDISYLSNLKEGLNVEFKESLTKAPESFYETYSSFSNTDGGIIYLGIKEGKRNKIVDVQNPIEQKKAIISAMHSKEKVSYCYVTDEDVQIWDIDGKKTKERMYYKIGNEKSIQ